MQQIAAPSREIEILQKLQTHAHKLDWDIQIRHSPSKRLFDLVFSSMFLIVTSPCFLILAILIRITSSGPVFYKSPRLGRGGKPIGCWKFRSMYEDAEARLKQLLAEDNDFRKEWELFQKVKRDPRITPIGKFLRKTSLDEFPQFWNVLKGDLSVVGPRPPSLVGPQKTWLQEIHLLYGEFSEKILSVRPGITGIWQISGRSQISFEKRCVMDADYAMHHTFWNDLIIIIKTIPAILFSKGAY